MVHLKITAEQKKHFNKLKAAYKACEKAGIILVNNYGMLEAYDSKIVEGYADSSTYDKNDEDVVSSDFYSSSDYINISNEWADDTHLIKLTAKGKRMLQNGEL